MAMTHAVETLYFVECDGCRRRAPFGFHRITAITRAKVAGFHRHEMPDKDRIWLCSRCERRYQVSEKTPLKVVQRGADAG